MFDSRQRQRSEFAKERNPQLEPDRRLAEGPGKDDGTITRNPENPATPSAITDGTNNFVWLEYLGQDIRYAFRRLRKAPVFSATAILTLALGIGATTSIFTLVHAVLLRSLSVSNPEELYRLGKETHCCVYGGFNQGSEFSLISYDLYKNFRDHTHGFAELAGFQAGQQLLGVRRTGNAEPAQSYPGEFVSGNYFSMFGLKAAAGRALTVSDDRIGAAPVAVMSYRLWQRRYGLDPSVIGSIFTLNDKPFTVVGISPPGFFGDTLRSTPADFFLPLATEPLVQGDSSLLNRVDTHWLDLIGRIQPGAKPQTIQAEMRVELQRWLHSHWGEMDANSRIDLPQQTLYLSPGGAGITSMRELYEHWLQILMMVSGFVLLIVCANVANLMLVRGLEQRPQISLSMALGARPSRLVRQALTESVVLSLLGGAAGLAVAFAGTRLILRSAFATLPGSGGIPVQASPSLPVLAFAFAVSVITGVVFGIAPAWLSTRVDPIEALRGASRSTGQSGSLPRKMLVLLQTALSLVLLSTSGLLTNALRSLENQNFGFIQDQRTIVNIDPSLAGYKASQLTLLYRRLHDSVANIPGVSSVALCMYSPFSGDSWNDNAFIEGRPAPGPKDDISSSWARVTAGYLDTVGMRLVRGRPISDQDTATSRHVAVVNEAFARKFFKGDDPIGKHFGRGDAGIAREYEIVGVAKDARYLTYSLELPVGPFYFVPESQYTNFLKEADTISDKRSHFLHDLVIRTDPGANVSEIEVRRAIAAVDPRLPVISVRTLKQQVEGQFSRQRLIARLTSLFGALSLVLASIGLYGVTAYNAGRRTNEIGLRMALGASRGHVLALVLRGAFTLIAFGLLLGLPLALASGRFLGAQLYGIAPYNLLVIAVSIGALGLSALIASLIPALRASLTSPLQALRAE